MTSRAELYRNWHEEASNNGSDTAVPCATEHMWCALESQTAVLERISEFHKLAELLLCLHPLAPPSRRLLKAAAAG